MANNRLYIGNVSTGDFVCITKDDGIGWMPFTAYEFSKDEIDKLNKILADDLIWSDKSYIILFRESDEFYYHAFHDGSIVDWFEDGGLDGNEIEQ